MEHFWVPILDAKSPLETGILGGVEIDESKMTQKSIKKDSKKTTKWVPKKEPKIDEKWSQKNEITSRYLHIPTKRWMWSAVGCGSVLAITCVVACTQMLTRRRDDGSSGSEDW